MEQKIKFLDTQINNYKTLDIHDFYKNVNSIINDYIEFSDLLLEFDSSKKEFVLTAYSFYCRVYQLNPNKHGIVEKILNSAKILIEKFQINVIETTLSTIPDNLEAVLLAGMFEKRTGNLTKSNMYLKQSCLLTKNKNELFQIKYNIIDNYIQMNFPETALMLLDELEKLANNNTLAMVHEIRGVIYTKHKSIKQAIKYLDKAFKHSNINQQKSTILLNKGLAVSFLRDFEESEALYERALFYNPKNHFALQNKCLDLLYQDKSMEDIFNEHKKINKILEVSESNTNVKKLERIRHIAVFSGDLNKANNHPVLHFAEIFNDSRFVLFCNDGTSQSDYPLAKVINSKNIKIDKKFLEDLQCDIAIDLSTFTDRNQLGYFAERIADVQIQYLGYPVFSGLNTIDYFISDDIVETEKTRELYGDKIMYSKNCFLNYSAKNYPIHYTNDTCVNRYAVFNKITKFSKEFMKTLREIQNRDPKALFVFKNSELKNSENKKYIEKYLEPEKIEYHEWSESHQKHCELFDSCDVALDTFPYSGTTTTCDSLAVGTPVITLKSDEKNFQNVSASILHHSKLNDYICSSVDEYIEKAIEFAGKMNSDIKRYNTKQFAENICDVKEFKENFFKMLESCVVANPRISE